MEIYEGVIVKIAQIKAGVLELKQENADLAAENESLKAANGELVKTLTGIANADWRKWDDGLNTPEAFVDWAKSRAQFALAKVAP